MKIIVFSDKKWSGCDTVVKDNEVSQWRPRWWKWLLNTRKNIWLHFIKLHLLMILDCGKVWLMMIPLGGLFNHRNLTFKSSENYWWSATMSDLSLSKCLSTGGKKRIWCGTPTSQTIKSYWWDWEELLEENTIPYFSDFVECFFYIKKKKKKKDF